VVFSKRKSSSVILLSVLIPVSLLATFRIAGIIPEPPIPQTITVETVSWNMSRPDHSKGINTWVNNSYSDVSGHLVFGVCAIIYTENHQERGDTLEFRVSLEANTSDGFIRSVIIRFSEIDTQAYLDIMEDPDPPWIELQNLSVKTIRDSRVTSEPYIEAIVLNQPKQALLSMVVFWQFGERNNMDHWVTLTAEITYFNGAEHQKVVIPIRLGVLTS